MSREPFSAQADWDVQERARDAVAGVKKATGTNYTLSQFLEDALARHTAYVEETYNDGQPFPPRRQPLPRGRPVADISWKTHPLQDSAG
ncbi:hypothetical protein [Pimelobacter sp. 30-1]|uniref:hypothetical protein n=1 Tax=Pimelobacter sp. 30-1 TaxID=2004991 RepID=UPI001C03C784|nr:hypothetical protein [Pimelobacter sp. 30-1]MBU2698909.1 hypothetical protein [Pimelobacter sp. 30-1]